MVLLVLSGLSFVAQRKKQPPPKPINQAPVITRFESSAPHIKSCGMSSELTQCNKGERETVSLKVTASDPDGDGLSYEYSISAGELFGTGPVVSWRLGDQRHGEYIATVKVMDSKGATATSTVNVRVTGCESCGIFEPCPVLWIVSPSKNAYRGEYLHFRAEGPNGVHFLSRPDYVWTVSNGKLIRGQHTATIRVQATGDPGSVVTATVAVEGLDPSCSKTASNSVQISADAFGTPCPAVSVSCPDAVKFGEILKFVATVTGGTPGVSPTYQWKFNRGRIVSGQGTNTTEVEFRENPRESMTGTVTVGGFDRSCATVTSCTANVH